MTLPIEETKAFLNEKIFNLVSAILNYLVGSMYSPKKVVDSIASTIVVSTLMSFVTIPVVVFFALKYFN